MKKLFTAIIFGAGAIFGMTFSPKKGEDIRKDLSKKNKEEAAGALGEDAKAMMQNFWSTIKGPLSKSMKEIQKELKKQGDNYGKQAKKSVDEWKKKAAKEIDREMEMAKKEIKKVKKTAKKKLGSAKKAVKKAVKKKK